MEKLNAIIIDDEISAQNVLKTLLAKHCPNITILDQCSDLKSGVKSIKIHQPNVVFLDIQMPKYNGYEITSFFDEINFEIIFVTAFDNHAIKAFELNALDYLVKPIDRVKLINSVERLSKKINSSNRLKKYELLVDSLTSKTIEQIVLPEHGNRRVVELSKIIAIEANGSYTKVYVENGPVGIVSKNLRYFENHLTEQQNFLRTHRSWLVNTKHIKEINKTSLEIVLTENIIAKISRNKLAAFEQNSC